MIDKIKDVIIKYKEYIFALCMIFFLPISVNTAICTSGKIIDCFTGKPIKGAYVTSKNEVSITDENGRFFIKTMESKIAVRAYGYVRTEETVTKHFIAAPINIKLTPFAPKGLYLSFYGIGDKTLREAALKLIDETELNALVIDVKGDRAMIPYRSSISLASEIGAQRIITVKDINGLIRSFKEKGIYTIARVVVFKDNLLAQAKPDWAIKTQSGEIWRDREGLAWLDPSRREVWDYVINIAMEAAQHGFDEIQFDYVRFPDSIGPQFSVPNTQENRIKAISGFLSEAKERLKPYNVFVSADIFGYVCWNPTDTRIGQRLEDLAPTIDYLSPMLYPSGFQYGIPGYRDPVAKPYEIILLSLQNTLKRTDLQPVRFRPWLQAFRDYAFDARQFTGKEIRLQIDAAEKFGTHGWMLWNPLNSYSSDGLKKENKNT